MFEFSVLGKPNKNKNEDIRKTVRITGSIFLLLKIFETINMNARVSKNE
jgi:hypothetical protein